MSVSNPNSLKCNSTNSSNFISNADTDNFDNLVATKTIVDYVFKLPSGQSTSKCELQLKHPIYFMPNPEFSPQYYVQLYNAVAAFGTFNYCGARIPLSHNKFIP